MEQYLKCADYRRISSTKQKDKNGDKMQEHANQALINRLVSCGNAEYVASYQDLAKSAFHTKVGDRLGIQELIKEVQAGRINCIVFYDESRVSRNFVDFMPEFVEPLLRANPDLVFYKSKTGTQWDPNSEHALSNVIDALVDSNRRAQVARDSQETDVDNHRRPGGRLPFGVIGITDKQLVPGPDLPIVVLIFELAAWGYSERAIAKYLTELGIKSSVEKKSEWSHTSIRHILSNKIYVGSGEWYKRPNRRPNSNNGNAQLKLFGTYQPLIPHYLWELAHANLEQRSSQQIARIDTPFLLLDIIECGKCNVKLKAKNSLKVLEIESAETTGSIYYYCPQCTERWNASEVHERVSEHLMSHVGSHFSREQIEGKIKIWKKDLDDEISSKQVELEFLEANYRRIMQEAESFEEDTRSPLIDNVTKALEQARGQVHTYSNLIAKLDKVNEIADLLSSRVLNLSESFSRIEQRYIVLSAIERVVAHSNAKTGEKSLDIDYRRIPLPRAI